MFTSDAHELGVLATSSEAAAMGGSFVALAKTLRREPYDETQVALAIFTLEERQQAFSLLAADLDLDAEGAQICEQLVTAASNFIAHLLTRDAAEDSLTWGAELAEMASEFNGESHKFERLCARAGDLLREGRIDEAEEL